MVDWELRALKKNLKFTQPLLIEGLPGIGNVGKIAADFLIDELQAKKIYDVFSFDLPNSVFVNEKNLVELPLIEIYHAKANKQDILILTGDVQPSEERSSYAFTVKILEWFAGLGGEHIITLGGIGLQHLPKKPNVYCTGAEKKVVTEFTKGIKVKKDIYGVVGPIVGVTGLLVGLSKQYKTKGICLLAETYNHAAYLGLKSARELLYILDKKLKLKINFKELDKEIDELNQALEQALDTQGVKSKKIKRLKGLSETSYIG
ncbi:hypothetical protein D6774_03075 [Candidatus Woesearchaeota archaeon]|nr:MAG: hypothetical protein D6774_03075 [Candidatus Woesearchaeota archaeon]